LANRLRAWPSAPGGVGRLAEPGGRLARVVLEKGAAPAQIALAWLLHRSPVTLPIRGTASLEHLEENVAASRIELSDEDIAALAPDEAARPASTLPGHGRGRLNVSDK
jgi:pyridoxine 4-dehydrogenase